MIPSILLREREHRLFAWYTKQIGTKRTEVKSALANMNPNKSDKKMIIHYQFHSLISVLKKGKYPIQANHMKMFKRCKKKHL